MGLSLWCGFWIGVLGGLWLGAGIAVLKLREKAKRRARNPWATSLSSGNRPSSSSPRMGLAAMMLAATPLDQNTGTHSSHE